MTRDNASTPVAVIDADPDGWTCNRPMVSGMYTTEEYARLTFRYVARCRRVNSTERDRCHWCHTPRPEEHTDGC